MTPTELRALADRVEALTGPDRETDAAIAAACRKGAEDWDWANNYPEWIGQPDGRVCLEKNGPSFLSPAYTASLDAALTLVPEGCWAEGTLSSPAAFEIHAPMTFDPLGKGWAATPALALTAAAIRSHASSLGE